MDAETSMRDERSHELREQIQQTQTDLGLKIGALEGEVRAVATQARDAVRERINAVRDVVDVRQVVVRRPIVSCIAAFGAGVLLGRGIRPERWSRRRGDFEAYQPEVGRIRAMVAPELGALRALLAGKVIGVLSDMVRNRLRGTRPESSEYH